MSTIRSANAAGEVPRRRFLQMGTAAGVTVLAGQGVRFPQTLAQAVEAEPPNTTFLHGVASGDPLADRVVLWTRVSGMPAEAATVRVSWTVSLDEAMTDVVAKGTSTARADDDWTVHVDATGLKPATFHWYGFEVNGARSPIGRTRTARSPEDPGEIRLGVVSCAALPGGYFNAYRHLANHDVDLVVHLGDYIYESYNSKQRDHNTPSAPVTLEEYRARYRQYRSDPDLQLLHRRHPFATIWDDHEVAGNAWAQGASNHQASTQGSFEHRRSAAMRAWFEWLPVRRPDPAKPTRVWRSLRLGAAAELIMLDTRHDGRDRQVDDRNPDPKSALEDPDRSLFSKEQREWLAERLTGSEATWRLVANQVLFSPFGIDLPGPLSSLGNRFGVLANGVAVNPDSWDGYGGERARVLATLADKAARNTVFLTGDVHSSWAFEVPGQAGATNPAAVELVVPAVSSVPFGQLLGGADNLVGDYLGGGNLINTLVTSAFESQLDHLRWSEIVSNGYLLASVTPERVRAEWWHLEGVGPDEKGQRRGASWQIATGSSRLVAGDPSDALEPRGDTSGVPPVGAEGDTQTDPGDSAPGPIALGVVGTAVAAAAGAAVAVRRRNAEVRVGQEPPGSF